MKRILLILALALIVLSGYSQSKLSVYSRMEMMKRSNPDTPEGKRSNALRNAGQTEYVEAFIGFSDAQVLAQLEELGVTLGYAGKSSVTARIPQDKLQAVSDLEAVTGIDFGQPTYHRMDKARKEGAVDAVHQGTDLPMPYTGKGVVVGIIDGGFEFAHTAFYDKEGKELRVKRVWNQRDSVGGTPVQSASGGVEYTTPEEIKAAIRDLDNETHGTHVAGIAAGAAYSLDLQGVAPDAELVFVATKMTDVGNQEGIQYCLDYAKSQGKPCVINMSLGGSWGPRDGSTYMDQKIDETVGKGAVFVVSAGNEGGDPCHFQQKFSLPTDTFRTFLKFETNSQTAVANVFGEKGKPFTAWVTLSNNKTGEVLFSTDTIQVLDSISTPDDENVRSFDITKGGKGVIGLLWGINPLNGKGELFFGCGFKEIESDDYELALHLTSADNLLNGWSDPGYNVFSSYGLTGYIDGDNRMSLSEGGPASARAITVGAYRVKDQFKSLEDGKYYPENKAPLDTICTFSSRGPLATGMVKPDIAAPGSLIVSSFSSSVLNTRYKPYFTNKQEKEGKTYYWGAMEGTSMAAPFTTGVIALWLQADPTLTPEKIKEIMHLTSTRDRFTGEIPALGSNTWGQGKINAMEGLKEVIRQSPTGITPIDKQTEILFIPSKCGDGTMKLFFTRALSEVTVDVINMAGRALAQQKRGAVGKAEEMQLQLPLPAGEACVVRVTSAEGVQSQKVAN